MRAIMLMTILALATTVGPDPASAQSQEQLKRAQEKQRKANSVNTGKPKVSRTNTRVNNRGRFSAGQKNGGKRK